MNKINFNKFIWFYWKMKKKNIFFVVFPVAGMRKKMVKKKKTNVAGWATTHSDVESRYNALYRDRHGWEATHRGAPQHGSTSHDTATTRPRYGQVAYDTTRSARG